MSVTIDEFNEFWAKVCQLYDETETGEKRVFLFQDNYECEELWSIDEREIVEDETLYFTTKLQFCSVNNGCTGWELELSDVTVVDVQKMTITMFGDRFKVRVEDKDYDFSYEWMNKQYYPF